jgi:hypothetical protein
LASEGLEVRIIPGDHLTMVEEPYAQVLAQELQICLDRADGAFGSARRKAAMEQLPQETPGCRMNLPERKTSRVDEFSPVISLST